MGKKSKPPPPPDYTSLAKQQAADQQALLAQQTEDNRPTQNTPWGSSSWTQDANKDWTQNITLDPAEQTQLDSQRQVQAGFDTTARGLLGSAQNSLANPLSFENLPELSNYDFGSLPDGGDPNSIDDNLGAQGQVDWSGMRQLDPGFGAVKEVQDAMMSRMQPARDQAREAALQRLRNQGLSENTEAFQRENMRLDQGDTDARQQALLGATSAYGDIFNRGLSANAQEMAKQFGSADLTNSNRNTKFGQNSQIQQMLAVLRGQRFGEQTARNSFGGTARQQLLAEREMRRQSPLNDLMKLQGKDVSSPSMPSFALAGPGQAADLMGAGKATYDGQLGMYNANQARSNSMMSGLFGLAGSALGGPMGGMLGTKLFS